MLNRIIAHDDDDIDDDDDDDQDNDHDDDNEDNDNKGTSSEEQKLCFTVKYERDTASVVLHTDFAWPYNIVPFLST